MKRGHIIALCTILGLAVLLSVGLLTGSAVAAPGPLDTHTPLTVTGTVEYVDWIFSDPEDWYYDQDGNLYQPGNLVTWKLHGDLEGTYVQTITYVMPADSWTDYGIEGRATFEGTVLGAKTKWTANVHGSGVLDISDLENHRFKGEDSWTSTITSSESPLSHMRGSIFIHGFYDSLWNSYAYIGWLTWQTGKKN
jgi:hypothetical protein